MKNIKNILKKFWKDESAQGMTEYILLLVIVVGLVLMFKTQITETLKGQVGKLQGELQKVTGQ